MERRFSEDQATDIIRRAAELSSATGEDAMRTSGISESELRRIAAEIGLPDTAIDDAIGEVGHVRSEDVGGDLTYERTFERRIDGDVGKDGYATLVEHFVPEWSLGEGTKRIGSLLRYRSAVGTNSCQVSLSQKAGKTVFRVTSHAWVSIMATFLPAALITAGATVAALSIQSVSPGARLVAFAAIFAVVWTAAILGNIKLVRMSNRKVKRLVDAAAADLSESASHRHESMSQSADGHVIPEPETAHIRAQG